LDCTTTHENTPLHNIEIILIGTISSSNIGSVARAMKNMGLFRLKLVNPRCKIDDKAFWMATCGSEILDAARFYQSLKEALSGSSYAFGTTARSRRWRSAVLPSEMAKKTADLVCNNKISIVFGPEDMGLSNDDLELCHEIVSIPTVDIASSINLSHAVMIICYEIYCAVCTNPGTDKAMELAQSDFVEAMYDHMRDALLEIGFLNQQKPDHTLGMMRRILTRTGLSVRETNMIRGLFRQLRWYVKNKKTKRCQ